MPMPIGRRLSFSFSSLCFTKPISFEYANILFNQGGSAEAKARLTENCLVLLSLCSAELYLENSTLSCETNYGEHTTFLEETHLLKYYYYFYYFSDQWPLFFFLLGAALGRPGGVPWVRCLSATFLAFLRSTWEDGTEGRVLFLRLYDELWTFLVTTGFFIAASVIWSSAGEVVK